VAVGDEGSDPSAREIRLGDPKGMLFSARHACKAGGGKSTPLGSSR
jgi:hypothetical protein